MSMMPVTRMTYEALLRAVVDPLNSDADRDAALVHASYFKPLREVWTDLYNLGIEDRANQD